MTLKQILFQTNKILKTHGIDNSYSEARDLLCSLLGENESSLISRFNEQIDYNFFSQLSKLIERRLSGEPLEYLTKKTHFYGLDFFVDNRVLIPRPETEILVDEAIKYFIKLKQKTGLLKIADIGTGCGNIAISIAKYLSNVNIIAIDISKEALEIAQKNITYHDVKDKITLLHSFLLNGIDYKFDIIIANLPYIPTWQLKYYIYPSLRYEPKIALDGGADGTKVIRQLVLSCGDKVYAGSCLLLEVGYNQSRILKPFIKSNLPVNDIKIIKDLNGIERVMKIIF